ncbi:MAG: YgiT-type zinc finger protein [Myxococcaceae bacterium]|jgi:YgiT-type zinc finger domain-containing protein|nr:YgiT-type zinc finger protein [Myxococcaceae bacterium]
MADYAKRDYGRCPCGGAYDNRSVEVRLTVNGKVVVLTDVPQGACPNCGSRVYKAEVLERIETLMKGARVRKAM